MASLSFSAAVRAPLSSESCLYVRFMFASSEMMSSFFANSLRSSSAFSSLALTWESCFSRNFRADFVASSLLSRSHSMY